MKIILKYVLIICLFLNLTDIKAQSDDVLKLRLSLFAKKSTLKDILLDIEKKANITFSYNENIIPNQKISIHEKNEELSTILANLLNPLNLTYSLFKGTVVIYKLVKTDKKYMLSGFVTDKKTGEKLAGVNIVNTSNLAGTSTNQDGYYNLIFTGDSTIFQFSYVGYEDTFIKIKLEANWKINIQLNANYTLTKVVITPKFNQNKNLFSEIKMNASEIRKIPALLGENDILKGLQLMPGVIIGNDGTTSNNIRGGSSEQNLVLLDDVPIYNPSHIYGFFSIFNSDIIKNFTLYKGALPGRYGGRISSCLDIRSIDGNKEKIKTSISLGFLTAKFSVDGPLLKSKKTTFVISGRRSYIDVLNMFSKKNSFNNKLSKQLEGYFFYDINAKITHRFNDKRNISFGYYRGNDFTFLNNNYNINLDESIIKEKERQNVNWGNQYFSIRYNQFVNKQLFIWALASHCQYINGNESEYQFTENKDGNNISRKILQETKNNLNNTNLSLHSEYKINNIFQLKSGGTAIYHRFISNLTSTSNFNNISLLQKRISDAIEYNIYSDLTIKIKTKLKLNIAAHHTDFSINETRYFLTQPRFNLNYQLNKNLSFFANAGSSMQIMHSLVSPSSGMPVENWLPSNKFVAPQTSKIYCTGSQYQFQNWVFNTEIYYKTMNNIIEYKDQSNQIGSLDNWHQFITSGTGTAKGLEVFLEKKSGKHNGWISYTLSKSDRQFREINNGEKFPFRFNRTHQVAAIYNYNKSKKWQFSSSFTIASGSFTTIPERTYILNSPDKPANEIFDFGKRNSYQLPLYNRLDFVINYQVKRKKFDEFWSFGLYNTYNRLNPFYVVPTINKNNERVLLLVTLFPILPNFNYKIVF